MVKGEDRGGAHYFSWDREQTRARTAFFDMRLCHWARLVLAVVEPELLLLLLELAGHLAMHRPF